MMIDQVPVPDNPVFDMETGLTLNWPAEYQLWPGWWDEQPDLYAKFVARRQALAIECLDFADYRFMPDSSTPEDQLIDAEDEIDAENALLKAQGETS